jgi:hypothetical protein
VPPNQVAITQCCGQRGIAQLVGRCVAAPEDLRLDILCGVPDSPYLWVDLAHARCSAMCTQDRAPEPGGQTLRAVAGRAEP